MFRHLDINFIFFFFFWLFSSSCNILPGAESFIVVSFLHNISEVLPTPINSDISAHFTKKLKLRVFRIYHVRKKYVFFPSEYKNKQKCNKRSHEHKTDLVMTLERKRSSEGVEKRWLFLSVTLVVHQQISSYHHSRSLPMCFYQHKREISRPLHAPVLQWLLG